VSSSFLGSHEGIPKPNLIVPREKLFVVFHKAVEVVFYGVWGICKNQIIFFCSVDY